MTGCLIVSLLEILLEGILESGCSGEDQKYLLTASINVDGTISRSHDDPEGGARAARNVLIQAALALTSNGHDEGDDEQYETASGEALSKSLLAKVSK